MTNQKKTLLSATIITKNEEKRIARCLDSLKWCDEVIISDSSSEDKTEEIARAYPNVRFFTDGWKGYGAQKNLAASRASHRWIFNIDADEWCDKTLIRSIQHTLAENPQYDAYHVHRKNFLAGEEVRFSGWGDEPIIRLYNKEKTAFTESAVHEGIKTENTGDIPAGKLCHDGFENREAFMQKHLHYAELAAKEICKKNRKITLWDIYGRSFFTFIKYYFLKLGVLDGKNGYFLATAYTRYCYNKYCIAQHHLSTRGREHESR